MNKGKKHLSKLFLFPLLVIIVLAAGGCPSSPASTPGSLPSEGSAIEANDSSVFCQIAIFGVWDGEYPRSMTVLILESEDVEGLANYTRGKIDQQIDVILDEDLDWLMMGQQITARVQLRANPEGGTSFYIYNITH